MWPKEVDHAHIRDIGLFLILVDSFSGWLEVIKVRDRKLITVRQILRKYLQEMEYLRPLSWTMHQNSVMKV